MVGAAGLEPAHRPGKSRISLSNLIYTPKNGPPREFRNLGQLIKSQLLYL